MVYVAGARGHDDRRSEVRAGTKVDEEPPLRRLSVASAAMGRAGKLPMNARGSVSPRIDERVLDPTGDFDSITGARANAQELTGWML